MVDKRNNAVARTTNRLAMSVEVGVVSAAGGVITNGMRAGSAPRAVSAHRCNGNDMCDNGEQANGYVEVVAVDGGNRTRC